MGLELTDIILIMSDETTRPLVYDQKRQKVKEILTSVHAVIFDMDGLMIDSEPYHCRAFGKVFRQFGKILTEEENNQHYVGISDKDAAEDMVRRYGLPLSPNELVKQKQTAYLEYLTQVTPQPGLLDLLEKLRIHKYKAAVASSSMLSEIEAVVAALKIQPFFDVLCSAQEVQYGKPAPDLFLFAAERLAIPPSQCLVLEDATSGVCAAKAAGMFSIAVPSHETMKSDFSLATVKVNSLDDIVMLFH